MSSDIVSIMMPAYNAALFIQDAIVSVIAQSYPYWELLIVDDGSTDRTPDIIAGFADKRIKVYHQDNSGESSARNTALKQASGKYLAFLDADDLYLPEHLEIGVAYLESHPQYGGVYTDGFYIDESGKQLKPLSSRRRGPYLGDIFEEMVRSSDVFGTPICVVLRKSVVSDHSLDFDPRIVIGPDWDFFTRFSEVALFGNIVQTTCLYRVHQTNISIQTGLQKRRCHLALCREKAIKLARFKDCSHQTQEFVFYDLLINLLTGCSERQSEVTAWEEFLDLPAIERARLFRLMASDAIGKGARNKYILDWLKQSRRLDPSDLRGFILNVTYSVSPQLCSALVNKKRSSQLIALDSSPFSDLA